jgi:hypothetical protein
VSRRRRLAWLLAALGGVAAATALAADVVVRATVDRPKPHVNESFTYTLRAEGQVRGEPNIAPLEQAFDVLQSTTSTRIQIVNGQAAQVSEWIYQLMPREAGPVTIPPVEVAGAQSNPVDLEVLPSNAAGDAPSDIFMEVEADPTTAYVQAQIVYTMRLFVGIGTGRATITPPEVGGGEAIIERLGEDRQYQTSRGGRNFVVHERRYAIFPQKAGTLTVGPATFEAMIMPNRGFSRVQRFRSGTLEITVKPAVPPPQEFPSAAWLPAHDVRLEEKWSEDPADLAVGVPVTRALTIEAEGLLETQLPKIELAKPQGIRQYADQPELDRESDADGLTARRTERYAVLAQTPGPAELPAVKLPWFDVVGGQWQVAEIPARGVEVAAGAESTAQPSAPAPEPAAAATPPAVRAPSASPFWPVTSGLLALAWLATAGLWWRARRFAAAEPPAPSSPAAAGPPRRPANRRLLRELRAACRCNDAETARNLLIEWAAVRFPDSPPRSLGALAKRAPSDLAGAVRALEAHLYGAPEGNWNGEALAAALAGIDSVARGAKGGDGDGLLPLYR